MGQAGSGGARGGSRGAREGARGEGARGQGARDARDSIALLGSDQRAIARADAQRARASQRAAKNLEELGDEQLREREIQREINSRRTRAARSAAREQLGPDTTRASAGRTRRASGGTDKLELAENLAAAGGEFERFSGRVESGMRSSFDAFSDYQYKVAEIGTITEDVTLAQIDAIAKTAVGEFGGAPIKQAEALQKVMSLGAASAADAQAQLMAANKLAKAGSAGVADSVVAISKSVANFKGVEAKEAADAIFAVTQASSAEVGDLAQALPRVAAGASMAGLTLQETVGTIGQLSNKLPDANQAVTGMIQMLSNIQKPTKAAREEAKRLGIDFSTSGIAAAGGWEQFMLKLRAAEGYDQDTLAKLFDSSEARIAVAAIVDDMEGLRKNLKAQEDAAGGTEKAYAKMTDTAAHKAALLEGQWETLKIQAGEQLIPAMTSVAEAVGPVLAGFQGWIKENPNLAATIAKLAVGTVVLTKGMGALISAYSMWQAVSGIAQLGNAKLATSTTSLTSAVTKQGTAMSATTKVGSGMGAMVGALPAVFAGAAVGVAAFDLVLGKAEAGLAKYESAIKAVEDEQTSISFTREATAAETAAFEHDKATKIAALQEQRKGARGTKAKAAIEAELATLEASTLGPVQKTDTELLAERRNRLISVVNASRRDVYDARSGGVGDDANLFEQALGGGAGLLNQATGVTEELERQRTQAELDLAQFDRQYGAQLGLGESSFTMPSGLDTGTLSSQLQELILVTRSVAENTGVKPAPRTTGPSMEAGLMG
jgi:TP901 family phage tail tape measure protein